MLKRAMGANDSLKTIKAQNSLTFFLKNWYSKKLNCTHVGTDMHFLYFGCNRDDSSESIQKKPKAQTFQFEM